MSRGILTASLVVVWLALSGFEHSLDLDFACYGQAHRNTQACLATPIEPNEIADDIKAIASKVPSWPAWTFHPSVLIPWEWFNQGSIFSKKDSKIYKLHGLFLI